MTKCPQSHTWRASPSSYILSPAMPTYQAPRGTADHLPADQPLWQHVTAAAHRVAARAGYQPIETPVFEETGVFERGVGADTDVVAKEMYTFEDKGNTRLTLRPEGTA